MADVINTKCPKCGAILELPPNVDRLFCVHCGGKVVIARPKTHFQAKQKNTTVACPHCSGKGQYFCRYCNGSGRCFYHYDKVHADSRVYGHYCKGGRCPICEGSGSEGLFTKCFLCHGSGYCPSCGGSARCGYCRGSGIATCTACSGSGYRVYDGP